MSAQTNPPPPTDPRAYFSGIPSTERNGGSDSKASKENNELFSGDINDIEVWLKYKKFLLVKENEDSERKLREKNAEKAYIFSRNWAIFIATLIVVYGFFKEICFKLTSAEFMFVIGSLTASILAYYLHVIKYLFYRNNNPTKEAQ